MNQGKDSVTETTSENASVSSESQFDSSSPAHTADPAVPLSPCELGENLKCADQGPDKDAAEEE